MVFMVCAIITRFMLHREVHHLHIYDNTGLWTAHIISGLIVASTLDKIDEMKDKYRSASGPGNRAMCSWVHLGFNGDIPDSEMLRLIDEAYNLIKAKYTKK